MPSILFAFPVVVVVPRVVYSLACFLLLLLLFGRRAAGCNFFSAKVFSACLCVVGFLFCRYARLHVAKTTTNTNNNNSRLTKTNNQHKSLNCQQLLKRVIMSQSTSTSASASASNVDVDAVVSPRATGARAREPKNSFLKCQRGKCFFNCPKKTKCIKIICLTWEGEDREE